MSSTLTEKESVCESVPSMVMDSDLVDVFVLRGVPKNCVLECVKVIASLNESVVENVSEVLNVPEEDFVLVGSSLIVFEANKDTVEENVKDGVVDSEGLSFDRDCVTGVPE